MGRITRRCSPASFRWSTRNCAPWPLDGPPVLTVHGHMDRTFPNDQAVRLDAALRKAGVPSYFVKVKGASHSDFPSAVDKRAEAFFAKYLPNEDPPVRCEFVPDRPGGSNAGNSANPRSNFRRPSRSNVRLLMSRPIHCLPRHPSANTQRPIRHTTWRFNPLPARRTCTETRIQQPDSTTIRCRPPLRSLDAALAHWTIDR